jgi:flagellar basal body P-ring protein FlgI
MLEVMFIKIASYFPFLIIINIIPIINIMLSSTHRAKKEEKIKGIAQIQGVRTTTLFIVY